MNIFSSWTSLEAIQIWILTDCILLMNNEISHESILRDGVGCGVKKLLKPKCLFGTRTVLWMIWKGTYSKSVKRFQTCQVVGITHYILN